MDIASVYLNLASLLGTEIEVEGYYSVQGDLWSVVAEPHSLRIGLARYVLDSGVMRMGLANSDGVARTTVKGRLRQTPLGEPVIDPIEFIRYTTDDLDYSVTFIHEETVIRCLVQADFILNRVKSHAVYVPLQTLVVARQWMSQPVLLKGSLAISYNADKVTPESFAVSVDHLVADRWDLLEKSLLMIFCVVVIYPFCILMQLRRPKTPITYPEILNVLKGFSSRVCIFESLDDRKNLYLYLARMSLNRKDLSLSFAGRLAYLDAQNKRIEPKSKLKFAALDYIRITKTMTFEHSQDE